MFKKRLTSTNVKVFVVVPHMIWEVALHIPLSCITGCLTTQSI